MLSNVKIREAKTDADWRRLWNWLLSPLDSEQIKGAGSPAKEKQRLSTTDNSRKGEGYEPSE